MAVKTTGVGNGENTDSFLFSQPSGAVTTTSSKRATNPSAALTSTASWDVSDADNLTFKPQRDFVSQWSSDP